MTPAEIQVKINIARREMEYWQNVLRDKSCEDCRQWQHRGCGMAGGAEPPPEIVKVGCDAWSWDEIPF